MRPNDEDETGLLKDKPINPHNKADTQELPDKILMYIGATFWIFAAVATIYYTNFFQHFFFSPKLYEPFHSICIGCYAIVICILIFSCFVLPYAYGIANVDDYNPKIMPTAAAFGFIGVITLIISVWPIWGFTTLLIFVAIWKGFFSMGVFIPKGFIGNSLSIQETWPSWGQSCWGYSHTSSSLTRGTSTAE